jgi:hypothetical protein
MSDEEMLFRCEWGRDPDTCDGDCKVVDADGVAWYCSHLLRPYQVEEEGKIVEKWEKAHIMPPVP